MYEKIRVAVEEDGYMSINEFILEALRWRIKRMNGAQHDAVEGVTAPITNNPPPLKIVNTPQDALERLKEIKAQKMSEVNYGGAVEQEAKQTEEFEEQMEVRRVAEEESKHEGWTPKAPTASWPALKFGKPLSRKTQDCPLCYEVVPVEFANDHYTQKHGGDFGS